MLPRGKSSDESYLKESCMHCRECIDGCACQAQMEMIAVYYLSIIKMTVVSTKMLKHLLSYPEFC